MVPDLKKYAKIVINSSAGKDSQAMLDYVVSEATKQGLHERRLCVVHCDLGRVEWPGTLELAREHAQHYGLEFHVVRAAKGRDFLSLVRERGRFPDSLRRLCTSALKRDPVKVLHTALARRARAAGWFRPMILDCLGMRAEESPKRRLLPQLETVRDNRRCVVDRWLPLHAWKLDDVWGRVKQAGTRPHPAYALGMPRLSCCFCVFAPKSALLLAGKHNPELLAEYVAVEREIGHTFQHRLSLAVVQAELQAGMAPAGDVCDWEM